MIANRRDHAESKQYHPGQRGRREKKGAGRGGVDTPGSPLRGAAVSAQPEGRRLRQLLVAVLGPKNALLSSNSETVGAKRSSFELMLSRDSHGQDQHRR